MSVKSEERPKIGAGHAQAMGRLGLAELRSAVYADSNVAQRHGELGLYGTATPQDVREQRAADTREQEGPGGAEPESPLMAERVERAAQVMEASRGGRERSARSIERE